ncbi:hypothetical protein [Moheibacter sp.]|uniref:hypothetical protein n=1 Tax=Moheibacter sp. TaxID=1965316 RepID=UPI003C770D8C
MISKLYISYFVVCFLIFCSCSSTKFSNKEIIPIDFRDDISWYPPEVYEKYDYFYEGNKIGLQNKNGKEILKAEFTNIRFLNAEYLLVEKEKLNGLANIKGEIILPIVKSYYSIDLFPYENPVMIIASNSDNKEEYYNIVGKEIYPPTNSFELRFFEAFSHNNKNYITLGDGFPKKLFKVENDTLQEIHFGEDSWEFVKLKNNLVSFYTEQNQIIKRGFYDINTEKNIILDMFRDYRLNEKTNEVWIKTDQFFDTIIDSVLNVKPNPIKNISKIDE